MELTRVTVAYAPVAVVKNLDPEVVKALANLAPGSPQVYAVKSEDEAKAVQKAFRTAGRATGRKVLFRAVLATDGTLGIEVREPRVRAKKDQGATEAPDEAPSETTAPEATFVEPVPTGKAKRA